MTKIKHFRMEVEVEMGMTGSDIFEKAEKAEARMCKEFDKWKNDKNIISVEYERNINGRYIEEDFSVSMHVLYEEE